MSVNYSSANNAFKIKSSHSDLDREKSKNNIMKTRYLPILILMLSLISFPSFSQTDESDAPLLGLPGDDLDLYAVLDLFQKSKTIEDFEKSLNEEKTGIVNLDLNEDGNADFIKVVTEKDGDNFLFILQDDISEKETQDVAIISVSKDSAGKVTMFIKGDETLYGKDYIVEPLTQPTESVTANPAYAGDDPVTVNVAATTEVIVVESTPVVQYVYSTTYVPYSTPYYYGYNPYWWRPVAVIGIGIYRHNHWHHHGRYYGGRGHTSVNINVNNRNTINNYNNNKRNTSNRVNNNVNKGNFNTAGKGGSRPSTSQASRGSGANASNRSSTKPSTSSGRTKSGASSSNRASSSNSSMPSTSQSARSSSPSSSNRSSASRSSSPSRSSSATRSRAGGGGRRR